MLISVSKTVLGLLPPLLTLLVSVGVSGEIGRAHV